MSVWSKLKRDFLAAMPVIGPHSDIECELLLAGKKPVGWVTTNNPRMPRDGWSAKKSLRDVKILDEAVANGKLKSTKLPIENDGVVNFYCLPEYEELMNLTKRQMQRDAEADRSLEHISWHQILGYRRRDELFWSFYEKLPENFRYAILNNSPSPWHLKGKLLRECGIEPHEWAAQLRAENIIS